MPKNGHVNATIPTVARLPAWQAAFKEAIEKYSLLQVLSMNETSDKKFKKQ